MLWNVKVWFNLLNEPVFSTESKLCGSLRFNFFKFTKWDAFESANLAIVFFMLSLCSLDVLKILSNTEFSLVFKSSFFLFSSFIFINCCIILELRCLFSSAWSVFSGLLTGSNSWLSCLSITLVLIKKSLQLLVAVFPIRCKNLRITILTVVFRLSFWFRTLL